MEFQKKYSRNKGRLTPSWKVQRSLKFIFTSWAFQVDQRCLSLYDWFLGLPDDHIWWGGLCLWMSLPYLLFSLGVLSSYLLCCLTPGYSEQYGEKWKFWLGNCRMLQILRLTMFFCFIHQRLYNSFQKKMVPDHCGISGNPRSKTPWSAAQPSFTVRLQPMEISSLTF